MDDEDSRRQLIDELWPVPQPPPDLAARVFAAMDGERRPVVPVVVRGRRGPLIAAASLSALAAGLTVVWWMHARPAPLIEEDGGWIAARRSTVNIGTRATASMQPGSDLTWSVRKERVRVQQRRGSVFYRVDRGGPFHVTTAAGVVEVTGTCFSITNGPLNAMGASALVSVLEGSVNVRTAGGTLRLTPGESARLRGNRRPERLTLPAGATTAAHAAELHEPPPPSEEPPTEGPASPTTEPRHAAGPGRPSALLLPASTRLRVFGNPLDRVSLALPAGRHPGIEVARDPRFRRPVFAGPARGPYVTVAAPDRGNLYWRVAGQSELAGHARFLPEARLPASRSVANLVTEGRPSTTINFQGAPPALTLSFAAAPGARSYQVRVFRIGGEEPVVERTVSEPRCALAPRTLGEGQYLWTVIPRDDAGRALGPRPLNKLELTYDNARSTLAITRTASGQVRGVAPLGARLFVNGAAAPMDDKGRFSLRPAGARVLVFRLVDGDGSESYWVRNVGGRAARKTL